MVSFRRWITALAVVALFVGLASAQVAGGGIAGPLACTANAAVTPTLRAEGYTELIGDIVLTCTGGTPAVVGQAIPTANITVSLGTNVTSRLLGNNSVSNASEALLLIDEPGSSVFTTPVTGFGPGAPQSLCSTPGVGAGPGGCVEFAASSGVNGTQVASSSSTGAATAPNVFQGLVTNNQVTFEGIPILAPVSAGVLRVYRITNVRANVAGLGSGLPGTVPLLASISISGSTSLPIPNGVLTAGFIQTGLSTVAKTANGSATLGTAGASFNQCAAQTLAGVSFLSYTENFGTAFKTRVAATTSYNGQSNSPVQNVPGNIYNSESGFVYPAASGNGAVAGLADYGTRLKATFNNIPSGVRIFVSVTNIQTNTFQGVNTVAPAQTSTSSYAVLVNGEASSDSNGFPPTLAQTTGTNSSGLGLYEIPQSNGSATAVWEVINTNPAALETINFGVYTTYSANTASNSPPSGTGTLNMSYAPTPTVPFSATAGGAASGSLTIPRFADTSTARNVLVVNICQTLLLFPFVTNASGFDTGLSIANTTVDPVGTGAQSGTCTLNWYDGSGKFPATGIKGTDTTKETAVAAGTVAVNLASALAPGFTGYMMALCNFQYAHGFAFISDIGARNLAMGYLALVVNNGTASARGPASETLGN